jgi:hypothetical protein
MRDKGGLESGLAKTSAGVMSSIYTDSCFDSGVTETYSTEESLTVLTLVWTTLDASSAFESGNY